MRINKYAYKSISDRDTQLLTKFLRKFENLWKSKSKCSLFVLHFDIYCFIYICIYIYVYIYMYLFIVFSLSGGGECIFSSCFHLPKFGKCSLIMLNCILTIMYSINRTWHIYAWHMIGMNNVRKTLSLSCQVSTNNACICQQFIWLLPFNK